MKRYIDPDSEIDKIKETIKKLENSERECGIIEQINICYLQQLVGHLENAPAADVVSREEYNSLLKRFKHLIQSEFISSFDEKDRYTHDYKRDIKEADQIAARFQIPKKPMKIGTTCYCANCGEYICQSNDPYRKGYCKHCNVCGQRLDWSD